MPSSGLLMSQTPFQLQDDILQMLFWMRGEKLGDEVSPEQLNRFLKIDESELAGAVTRLVDRGLLERLDDQVRLTTTGIEEGRVRFLDEFSTYLGKDTHLACSDPECDCRNEEWAGICRSQQTQS